MWLWLHPQFGFSYFSSRQPSLNTNHKQRIQFGFPHLLSSGSGYTYHRLFTMQRRFFLNSELVIKRLLRSVVNKPKRSSTLPLRKEKFATLNVGAGSERSCALRKKGRGFDDQSNQIHIMTARSDTGIWNEALQMHWDQTAWLSGENGSNCDVDKNSIFKWDTILSLIHIWRCRRRG